MANATVNSIPAGRYFHKVFLHVSLHYKIILTIMWPVH